MDKPLFKLSPSTLNLFLECKRCFYKHIKLKQKRPDSIFPSLPSGMDKILKEHFDKHLEKDKLPQELKELKGYNLFKDKELLKIWRSNFKGLQFLDKKSNILLRGAVDNILVKGKKLVVLDYKTRGYPLKEDTHEHYINQMDLYNFLLRKNGYETEDYTYLLFYYPNCVNGQGDVVFDTKLVKVSTSWKRGEKVFKDAVKVLMKDEIPSPGEDCQFCRYCQKV
jgi:hypothetical protein